MQKSFEEELIEYLLIARDEVGIIQSVDYAFDSPLETDSPELIRLNEVHKGIAHFYRETTDGVEIKWKTEKWINSIDGRMVLAEAKHLFQDARQARYYNDGDDPDLQYFQAWDHCSPETCVGFIMTPELVYPALYYLSGDYELYNLDLDFSGYTQMAVAARVFNSWQVVLLRYMGDYSTSAWTEEQFKAEMPEIFPGWTWEMFIEKFESLRLSKRG